MKNRKKIESNKIVCFFILFVLIIIFAFLLIFIPKSTEQIQQTQLYFAYGSNMNIAQMNQRCPTNLDKVGSARLDDYEFGFDSRGYANIRSKQGEYVWGFVWKIDELCVSSLDRYEGYPNVYNRKNVVVIDKNGKNLNAFVYIQSDDEFGGIPQKDYLLNKIIPGAIENGLPNEWINKLNDISVTP